MVVPMIKDQYWILSRICILHYGKWLFSSSQHREKHHTLGFVDWVVEFAETYASLLIGVGPSTLGCTYVEIVVVIDASLRISPVVLSKFSSWIRRASPFWLIHSVVFNAPPSLAAAIICILDLHTSTCARNLTLFLVLTIIIFNFGAIGVPCGLFSTQLAVRPPCRKTPSEA